MRLKNGVSSAGVKTEILLIIPMVEQVFNEYGKELIITSITDGKHSKNSLHYEGLAFDCRIRHLIPNFKSFQNQTLKAMVAEIAQKIREKVGSQYDVVQERTHIHIEFDPK